MGGRMQQPHQPTLCIHTTQRSKRSHNNTHKTPRPGGGRGPRTLLAALNDYLDRCTERGGETKYVSPEGKNGCSARAHRLASAQPRSTAGDYPPATTRTGQLSEQGTKKGRVGGVPRGLPWSERLSDQLGLRNDWLSEGVVPNADWQVNEWTSSSWGTNRSDLADLSRPLRKHNVYQEKETFIQDVRTRLGALKLIDLGDGRINLS